MRPDPTATPRSSSRGRWWFRLGALAGGIHAAISFYWAAGGQWLLSTIGSDLVDRFRPMMWALGLVALVKLVGTVGPLLLDLWGWPWPRVTRSLTWLAALVLVGWGGLGAIVANGVLLGVVKQDGGYDRDSMIGHAWLWDPLFVVWGIALAAGLWASRRPRPSVARRA